MIELSKIEVLLWPFLACLVLVGIHGYLGIHVLARKVIFVDLAMAQIAALGGTVAFLYGHEIGTPTGYFLSLGFTLAGAGVFALTRTRHESVPQEAVIGLVYAIATAVAVLLADRAAHGGEHLKALLSGSIVWVTWKQVARTAAIYAVVGAFHYAYRAKFLKISLDPEGAAAEGVNVRLWDFLFYLTFGFVITSSVSIAGVLLVFCYLIAPAVVATLFAQSVRARLLMGWIVGTLVSALGLLFSWDRPSGPTIIGFFAAFLALAAVGKAVFAAQSRARALAIAGGGTALLALVGFFVVHFLKSTGHDPGHSHPPPRHAAGDTPEALLLSLHDDHADVRAAAARSLGEKGRREAVPMLRNLLRDTDAHVREEAAKALGILQAKDAILDLKRLAETLDEHEYVPLEAARALAEMGEVAGIEGLLRLASEASTGLVKRLALKSLKQLLPEANAPAEEKRGLAELKGWWEANRALSTFDDESRCWRKKS
ncbi:MAG: ABC-type transporter integral membrane [Planctomycetota bacterium]|nr:MAG: ABC-type transporter integral membrane [Planctomycetota bacterium]